MDIILKTKILRRLSDIDNLVDMELRTMKNICKYDIIDFHEILVERVIENIYYFNNFADFDNFPDDWDDAYHMIEKYIISRHKGKINNFYKRVCQ